MLGIKQRQGRGNGSNCMGREKSRVAMELPRPFPRPLAWPKVFSPTVIIRDGKGCLDSRTLSTAWKENCSGSLQDHHFSSGSLQNQWLNSSNLQYQQVNSCSFKERQLGSGISQDQSVNSGCSRDQQLRPTNECTGPNLLDLSTSTQTRLCGGQGGKPCDCSLQDSSHLLPKGQRTKAPFSTGCNGCYDSSEKQDQHLLNPSRPKGDKCHDISVKDLLDTGWKPSKDVSSCPEQRPAQHALLLGRQACGTCMDGASITTSESCDKVHCSGTWVPPQDTASLCPLTSSALLPFSNLNDVQHLPLFCFPSSLQSSETRSLPTHTLCSETGSSTRSPSAEQQNPKCPSARTEYSETNCLATACNCLKFPSLAARQQISICDICGQKLSGHFHARCKVLKMAQTCLAMASGNTRTGFSATSSQVSFVSATDDQRNMPSSVHDKSGPKDVFISPKCDTFLPEDEGKSSVDKVSDRGHSRLKKEYCAHDNCDSNSLDLVIQNPFPKDGKPASPCTDSEFQKRDVTPLPSSADTLQLDREFPEPSPVMYHGIWTVTKARDAGSSPVLSFFSADRRPLSHVLPSLADHVGSSMAVFGDAAGELFPCQACRCGVSVAGTHNRMKYGHEKEILERKYTRNDTSSPLRGEEPYDLSTKTDASKTRPSALKDVTSSSSFTMQHSHDDVNEECQVQCAHRRYPHSMYNGFDEPCGMQSCRDTNQQELSRTSDRTPDDVQRQAFPGLSSYPDLHFLSSPFSEVPSPHTSSTRDYEQSDTEDKTNRFTEHPTLTRNSESLQTEHADMVRKDQQVHGFGHAERSELTHQGEEQTNHSVNTSRQTTLCFNGDSPSKEHAENVASKLPETQTFITSSKLAPQPSSVHDLSRTAQTSNPSSTAETEPEKQCRTPNIKTPLAAAAHVCVSGVPDRTSHPSAILSSASVSEVQTASMDTGQQCGMTLASGPSLSSANGKQHVQSGRKKRTRLRTFQCHLCSVACSNRGQLRGHLRTHTGERPFPCLEPGCNKTFVRNEELTRHRRIHSGERPYSCNTCGKAFTRKDHLNKHVRMHTEPVPVTTELMDLS